MDRDHDEIEWQFDTDDPATIRPQLARIAGRHGLKLGRRVQETHRDTYFDTGDWRVYRSGYALRLRQSAGGKLPAGEATLKSLASGQTGVRQRREISEQIARVDQEYPATSVLAAPGPVGERVKAVTGPARLEPIFDVITTRQTFPLSMNGKPAGEIALDDTTIPGSVGQTPGELRRVEIEVRPEAQAALQPFVSDLAKACNLRPVEQSKFETALRVRGLSPMGATHPAPAPPATDLHKRTLSAGELALTMLRQRIADLLACEPAARMGDDAEALHDMRVATRRLRAILRIFEDALPARCVAMRDELRWVAGALGGVRDLDVHLEQVGAWLNAASSDQDALHEALETLAHLLQQDRSAARKRMLEALDSDRYARLIANLDALQNREPARLPRRAGRPAQTVMPDLVERRYKRVRRLADALNDESAPEDFHAVRIQCKRLRYTLDGAEPLYGKPVRALIKRLSGVQDSLGQYQDTQVAVARMRDLCSRHRGELSPATVRALGDLAQQHARAGDQFIQQFWPAYRKLKGRAWKRLRNKMDKERRA